MSDVPSNNSAFKICNMCKKSWSDIYEFTLDVNLRMEGYIASFEESDEGIFILTHIVPDCGSTLAVYARDFRHFYNGPPITHLNTGSDTCAGHCLHKDNLHVCHAECSMKWARIALQFLKYHELPQHLEHLRKIESPTMVDHE